MSECSLNRCRNILEIIICALESIIKLSVLEDLLLSMIKNLLCIIMYQAFMGAAGSEWRNSRSVL